MLAEPGPADEGDGEGEDDGRFADARGRRANPFVQLGTPDDIYCSGYIGEVNEQFPFRVIGSEYEVLGPTLDISDRGKISATFGLVDAIKVGVGPGWRQPSPGFARSTAFRG